MLTKRHVNRPIFTKKKKKKKTLPKLGSAIKIKSFPGVSAVKNLLALQEMWVQSLGGEHPLEKERATHSSVLAWEIPWAEEPGRLQVIIKP